ncbi:MAG: PHP domain-containing protein [Synechococcales bacterium]|nr:PHP domain-containing protein [Synechococcales bacterium]
MAVELIQAPTAHRSASTDLQTLKNTFEGITHNSCPFHYNFHLHTVCSDGQLQPEDLIQQAIRLGLRGLAITDHHSIEGFRRASRYLTSGVGEAEAAEGLPTLWPGVEVNAGLLETEVHVLCYGFNPQAATMQPYLQGQSVSSDHYPIQAVIQAAHGAGGVAVLAHPSRYRRSPTELIPAAAHLGIDGVETYYAYDNPTPWRPSPRQTHLVSQLAVAHQLLQTCGTDTHGLSITQRL